MTKITANHLGRAAFVYIRQSTADQLLHNPESRRRQYGLADRARQLGWTTVEVIDDDLGRSGGGINRPGFERLLAAICEGRVGAVFAIEASRLARNGRDWHTLIEFCGLVGTHNILTNPVHAGAYAFGRTMSKVSVEDGRKRVNRGLRRPLAEWDVLLKDQHEGYISWSQFERNQQVIADNATGKGSAAVRGAVRRGELLLAGLLRCGHCGRKLYVGYGGKAGRYYCQGALVNHGTERCISFGGLRVDHAVGSEVVRVLKPLGVNAAVKALEAQTSETSAAQRQLDLALQQARFSAAHARRQYDAVDPDNRLVAGELERRWNEALQVVYRLEGEAAALEARKPARLGEKERRHLLQLGANLELAWSHPAATAATRKRILRAALYEIVVRIEGSLIEMVLHWQGGDHTALKLKINGAGKHRWTVPEDTLSLIRELARLMPDQQIARLLNRAGKPTGRGNGWTQARVCSFRNHHGIAVYRDSEWAERGEISLEAAAQIMNVSIMTALRMVRRSIIKGRQLCRGAPWVIKVEDMAAYREQKPSRRSLTSDPAQQSLMFQ